MAAPRMKPPVKKKKPPVKKTPVKKTPVKKTPVKKPDVKSPAETRKSISRKQVGTSRPARGANNGGLRAQYLKDASKTAASRTLSTVLRTGLKVAGPVGALVSMTVPAGEGSTKDKYSTLKKKYSSAIGPKQPAGTKKSSGYKKPAPGTNYTPKKRLENRLMKPAPGTNYSGQGTASGNDLRRAGAGTFTASYDVKAKKTGPSNTAATAAAAVGSSGTSQATKKKSRSPTRYQRNELAMEQRKSPSGKPKKSIFTSGKPKKSILSLFRKG